MMRKWCVAGLGLLAVWLAVPAPVLAVPVTVVKQDLQQGGFYVGRVAAGSRVSWKGEPVIVGDGGLFVIGFDRHQGPKGWVKVCGKPGACETVALDIAPRTYKTQAVKGVAGNTVNPNPAEVARTEADSAAAQKARTMKSPLTAFAGPFVAPVKGPITGGYGTRRTYNGEERSWHKGGDFAAKTGTPVVAPADAVVRLVRDTFMSGNLIILDHGQQVYTAYAHLSRMDVAAGDRVKQGQVIGAVGTTGRSTGPHLHWGLYWKNMALDPMLWLTK